MFYHAISRHVKIGNTAMDYVSFGKGDKNLVIIPGLGDGLKTVKGAAIALALMYKRYAKDYTVYFFSRKNHLDEGYSTREMATDLHTAMAKLNIQNAHVMGLSQGGMISQFLAIDHPQSVDKLVIGVSASRPNKTMETVVNSWITMATNHDYKSLFISSIEKTYPEDKAKKFRPFYPILTKFGKPKSFDRFIIQARSCLSHNAYKSLAQIKSPTLIIGGDCDLVVGKNASEEMAAKISNSTLYICNGLGHGAFEDKAFNQLVLDFLKD
ncbi:alpha/beta fold hydrolase [Acetobacterium carbinolicum]|uniref:alpha/beta fold hydrolase n=1 Tax=Acetobacterium carbinolicum TaxID=52690 RepID=UPI0039C98FA3